MDRPEASRTVVSRSALDVCDIDAWPVVTVLITARNRPDELAKTLRLLQRQRYERLEVMVIDDASDSPLGPVALREWPDAKLARNESPVGYMRSRSHGMTQATGEYVMSLDDDSCLTRPDDIQRAVLRLEREPQLAVLTFFLYEGDDLPSTLPSGEGERYVGTFSGCAHMIRKDAIQAVGGYRDLYFYYAEEPEYSIRLIAAGWRILSYPAVVVHHRVSPIGRSWGRILAYSYRNNVWTALLLYPFPRVMATASWRVLLNSVKMTRRGELRWLMWAVGSLLSGLPWVVRHRAPVSTRVMRTLDSLNVRMVSEWLDADLERPVTIRERWRRFSMARSRRHGESSLDE